MAEIKEKVDFTFKILVLGEPNVGKVEFINRFTGDKYNYSSIPTTGLDIKHKYLKRDGKIIKLEIWDTAGQERFRYLAKRCYQANDGIIMIYDASDKGSFGRMKSWINNIKENIDMSKTGVIIVSNKCELSSEGVVDEEIKITFEKRENIKIIEASSKDNINVNESFLLLVDKMIELRKDKYKYENFDDENEEDKVKKLSDKKIIKKKRSNCLRGI